MSFLTRFSVTEGAYLESVLWAQHKVYIMCITIATQCFMACYFKISTQTPSAYTQRFHD